MAELEAVLKGINLCAKWNLKNVVLVTDSATVFGWIKLTLTEEKKVKTKRCRRDPREKEIGNTENPHSGIGADIYSEASKVGRKQSGRAHQG